MNVDSGLGSQDTLNANRHAMLVPLDGTAVHLFGSKERMGQQKIGGFGHLARARVSWFRRRHAVNGEVHVLYLPGSLQFIVEAARGRPNEQISRDTFLQRLDKNLVLVALDLEGAAADGDHHDWLAVRS